MNDFEIIDFKIEHFEELECRSYESQFVKMFKNPLQAVTQLTKSGPSFTLIIRDQILAIGGFFKYWDGVFECWQIPSKNVPAYAKNYSRHVRYKMREFERQYNIKRVQSSCPNDDSHDRWMKFLGFSKECILKKFGPLGEDYALHARLI